MKKFLFGGLVASVGAALTAAAVAWWVYVTVMDVIDGETFKLDDEADWTITDWAEWWGSEDDE